MRNNRKAVLLNDLSSISRVTFIFSIRIYRACSRKSEQRLTWRLMCHLCEWHCVSPGSPPPSIFFPSVLMAAEHPLTRRQMRAWRGLWPLNPARGGGGVGTRGFGRWVSGGAGSDTKPKVPVSPTMWTKLEKLNGGCYNASLTLY